MQRAITLANSLPGVDGLAVEDYDGWHFHRLAWTECQPALRVGGNAHIALTGNGIYNTLSLFPCVSSSLYTAAGDPGKSHHVLRLRVRMHRSNLRHMTQRLRGDHGQLLGFSAAQLKATTPQLDATIAAIDALPQDEVWLEPVDAGNRPTIKASHHLVAQYEISNTRDGGNHLQPGSFHNLRRVCLARRQRDPLNESDSLLFLRRADDPGSFDVLALPHGHPIAPLGGAITYVPGPPGQPWVVPADRIGDAAGADPASHPVIPFEGNPLHPTRYAVGAAPAQQAAPDAGVAQPPQPQPPVLGQNVVADYGGEPLHDIQNADDGQPAEPAVPNHEPTLGEIYFAIRIARQGDDSILMPYAKVGQATGQDLSRGRENAARRNTDHPLLDAEGRRIEHYVVALYVCTDVRGIEGNTGLRGYLGSEGFPQHREGTTRQRENVLLFDATAIGTGADGLAHRSARLLEALNLMRQYAVECEDRVEEFQIVRPNILESIGIEWDNLGEVNADWAPQQMA